MSDERGEQMLQAIYDEIDMRLNPTGDECWNCGGEGETWDCIDGCCEDADYGCDDCRRPCVECALFAWQRAKAIREEVIRSRDTDIAIAWLKSIGRWNDKITREQVDDELRRAAELDAQSKDSTP